MSRATAWGIVVTIALAGGCSSASPQVEGPWAAEFEQAIKDSTSDLERDVLRDGNVTDAEFQEAADAYVECMADLGVAVKVGGTGANVQYETSDTPGFDKHDESCREGTVALVGPLYVNTRQNPENRDVMDLVAECLVRLGAADPGYTGTSLSDEMASDSGVPLSHPEEFTECVGDPSTS